MNSIIGTEVVKTASNMSSALPLANSVVETMSETAKGLSTTSKIAIGAGVAGVVVVGGAVGYKVYRKKHPKQTSKKSKANMPEKPLDDEADDIDEEDTIDEKALLMHEVAVSLSQKLYSQGYTDEKALMCMVSTCINGQFQTDVSFEFIKDTVAAGIAAAKSGTETPKDKDDETK